MKNFAFNIFHLVLLHLIAVGMAHPLSTQVPSSMADTVPSTSIDYDEDVYYILTGEADKAIADSDYVTAINRIKEALETSPNNPGNIMLLSNLGTLYNYLDQDSLALQALNKANALAPSMTTVIENRARLLLKMGDKAGAFRDFGTVLERDSLNIYARFYHGMMALYGGDQKQAQADFGVLESEARDAYITQVAMSSLYSFTGRDREAIPYYKKLIDNDPSPEYYAALAGCQLAIEELSDAAATIEAGLKLFPLDPELFYYRARLNRDRFRLKEAKEDAEKAIKLGADPRRVHQLFGD